jgi:hypothetical protein
MWPPLSFPRRGATTWGRIYACRGFGTHTEYDKINVETI